MPSRCASSSACKSRRSSQTPRAAVSGSQLGESLNSAFGPTRTVAKGAVGAPAPACLDSRNNLLGELCGNEDRSIISVELDPIALREVLIGTMASTSIGSASVGPLTTLATCMASEALRAIDRPLSTMR